MAAVSASLVVLIEDLRVLWSDLMETAMMAGIVAAPPHQQRPCNSIAELPWESDGGGHGGAPDPRHFVVRQGGVAVVVAQENSVTVEAL